MGAAEERRAVAAATSVTSALDLAADDAVVVSSSNRLVVRLLPCDRGRPGRPALHDGSADREVEHERRQPGRHAGSGRGGPSLLAGALRDLRRSIVGRRALEQLLHGEPHAGKVLRTTDGPLFIDFENTTRGAGRVRRRVDAEGGRRPLRGADPALVDECRGIVLAMVAMYQWRVGDRHPSRRPSGVAFLDAVRRGPPWAALDDVAW